MPVLLHLVIFERNARRSTSPTESNGVGIGRKTPRKSSADSAALDVPDELELTECLKTRHYSQRVGSRAIRSQTLHRLALFACAVGQCASPACSNHFKLRLIRHSFLFPSLCGFTRAALPSLSAAQWRRPAVLAPPLRCLIVELRVSALKCPPRSAFPES